MRRAWTEGPAGVAARHATKPVRHYSITTAVPEALTISIEPPS